jgi:excinuclease ABC subunit A
MKDQIRIEGARQHNLKGVSLSLPRRAITVVTGPSGSGKSSLAFDTIYAEGQRRYIESLSTYAKQFLERMAKPDVDWIEGVSPSVAIDQNNSVKTSRSTVGTVTEVYDYLRLLWARVGRTYCPDCNERIVPDTVQSAAERVLEWDHGTRIQVAFPLVLSTGISEEVAASNIQAQGYVRVIADGEEVYLPDVSPGESALKTAVELLVVVDRLSVDPDDRERLLDSLAAAFAEGGGHAVVLSAAGHLVFAEAFRCARCGRDFPDPRPVLFSFNSPAGACPKCTGFGATLEYDERLIVPDPARSLEAGALDPWAKPRYRHERSDLRRFAAGRGIDTHSPWMDLPPEVHGSREFGGVVPFLRSKERKKYKQYIRVFLRQYQLPRPCDLCQGSRLVADALNVRLGGLHIAGAAALGISSLRTWLAQLALSPFEQKVASTILKELRERTRFLDAVGLGYLTLDRQARSLSGGEMQRIRLAACLGSHLVDTLYVLDEPTIGLHPRDVERFMSVLEDLRRRGNTVLVVEHEPRAMERADWIVELGPGSGESGGEVVFEGTYPALLQADTTTGIALAGAGRHTGEDGKPPREPQGWLRLRGASLHNIRGLDVKIPLGVLVAITGVSGSGKSTLVHDILYRAYEALEGTAALDRAVLVDQSPIGRTPRSNPATYIGAFSEIRRLLAEQPLARERGYGTGHFSFNRPGGRCEVCKGAGEEVVEMVFMADVAVPCDACGGKRFLPELLEVEFRGRNIDDILALTVDAAIRFFIRQDRLGEQLWQLQRVGLGYLRLGQPATTLSGGEAQRLKIARELARSAGAGRRLYILDEPTVGLGLGEIGTLLSVLRELVMEGHSVLVVEHNLDLIARADWVLDLGPEAAEAGGELVAEGTPLQVMEAPGSHTGSYLRRYLEESGAVLEASA